MSSNTPKKSAEISERSQAIRTAGVTGAVDAPLTAAGLAQRFMQRFSPVVHSPASETPTTKASTVKCPRCSGVMTMAKLGDESEVEYCPRCRIAVPAHAMH